MKTSHGKTLSIGLVAAVLVVALEGCGGRTPSALLSGHDQPVPSDAGLGSDGRFRPDVGVDTLSDADAADVGIDRPDLGLDRPDVADGGIDRPDLGLDRPDVADGEIDRPDRGLDHPDVADGGIDRPDLGLDRPDVADVGTDRPDLAVERYDMGGDRAPDLGFDAGLKLVSFIQSVGGTPIRVLKQDQYVYLGDWENRANPAPSGSGDDGSIQTYDVTDPLLPVLRSTLFTPGDQIQDLAINGQWLFEANDALGLRLVDISKPGTLKSVTNRLSDSGEYATSVAVTERGTDSSRQLYAFAGYLYGGALDIHAVPDGGPIPKPIHYTSEVLPTRCDVYQIQISGDRAYILTGDGESVAYVEILDISQLPAVPTVLGRIKFPFVTYGGIGDIRLSGDLLYYSASDYTRSTQVGGLRIINVKDPTQPALVGSLDLSPSAGAIDWKGTGLAVAGQAVYFITSSGVKVIDVSDPSRPTLRNTAAFPTAFGTCQGGTAVVDGDLLYVGAYCRPSSDARGGLAIYRRW